MDSFSQFLSLTSNTVVFIWVNLLVIEFIPALRYCSSSLVFLFSFEPSPELITMFCLFMELYISQPVTLTSNHYQLPKPLPQFWICIVQNSTQQPHFSAPICNIHKFFIAILSHPRLDKVCRRKDYLVGMKDKGLWWASPVDLALVDSLMVNDMIIGTDVRGRQCSKTAVSGNGTAIYT